MNQQKFNDIQIPQKQMNPRVININKKKYITTDKKVQTKNDYNFYEISNGTEEKIEKIDEELLKKTKIAHQIYTAEDMYLKKLLSLKEEDKNAPDMFSKYPKELKLRLFSLPRETAIS